LSSHLTIVVPAYNEQDRIQAGLQGISEYYSRQEYPWNVIVVSDGSTDETNALVEGFVADHPEFSLLAYSPNRGKGYAVRQGMLAATGDLILFMDADLATPCKETEKLLHSMKKGADIAIGSRPMRESNLVRHQPPLRELVGRMANKLVQALAVKGITDTQCGFKMFTSKVSQDVFKRCKLTGFSFDFEALMIARDLGYQIDEVAIEWSHQEGSKVVFWRDYPRALRDLIRLRLTGKARRLEFNEHR
jgi:dolichyl-phosphate beta-glucosyltransferase